MMAVAAATAFGPTTAATIKLDGRSLLHPHPQNDDDKNLVANKQLLNHPSFTHHNHHHHHHHHHHHAVVHTNNINNNNSSSSSSSSSSSNNNNKNNNKNNYKNNKNNKNNNSNNNNLLSMTATSAIGRIVPIKTGTRPTTTTLRVIAQQDDDDNVMTDQRLHDNSFVRLDRRDTDTYQQHGFEIDG